MTKFTEQEQAAVLAANMEIFEILQKHIKPLSSDNSTKAMLCVECLIRAISSQLIACAKDSHAATELTEWSCEKLRFQVDLCLTKLLALGFDPTLPPGDSAETAVRDIFKH